MKYGFSIAAGICGIFLLFDYFVKSVNCDHEGIGIMCVKVGALLN